MSCHRLGRLAVNLLLDVFTSHSGKDIFLHRALRIFVAQFFTRSYLSGPRSSRPIATSPMHVIIFQVPAGGALQGVFHRTGMKSQFLRRF